MLFFTMIVTEPAKSRQLSVFRYLFQPCQDAVEVPEEVIEAVFGEDAAGSVGRKFTGFVGFEIFLP